MKITVNVHDHLESFPANTPPAFARVYYSTPFTNDDDESIGAGSLDSDNYYVQVAVSYSAGVTTIPSFTGATELDSTVYGITGGNHAIVTLALYSAKGKRLAIVYTGIRIPQTPTTTTWADLDAYSNAPVQPYRHAYYDVDQINALLNGLQIAPLASDVIYGRSRLSTVPVSLSAPIAVGDNDARVNTINAAQYGTFSAAVDAVAALSGTNILEISTSISTTAKTVPADVILSFVNGGKLTAVFGAVTILGEIRAPAQQIFVITGGTVNIAAAKFETAYFEWYGITSGADNSTAMQRLITARKGTYWNSIATRITLLPGTTYSFASTLSLDGTWGIGIVGSQGVGLVEPEMRYTGTGTAAITMKSTKGFTASGVHFTYDAGIFAGTLILMGDGGAPEGFGVVGPTVFERCAFTGTSSAYSAVSLVTLEYSIDTTFRDCTFSGGLVGVTGRTATFANNVMLDSCLFSGMGRCITNTYNSWTIQNCTFEPTSIPMSGGILAGELRVLDSPSVGWNLVFNGNWIGDMSDTVGVYSVINLGATFGAVLQGNLFFCPNGGTGTVTCITLNGCYGVVIQGNYIKSHQFISYVTSISTGVALIANMTTNCITPDPVSVGGIDAAQKAYFGGDRNKLNRPLDIEGHASALVGTDNQIFTLGSIQSAAVDNGQGSAIRITGNVAGFADGSIIIQPRTTNVGSGAIAFRTYNKYPLTIDDTNVTLTDNLIFSTDNTKDIGAVGATRPRTGYFATSVIVPTITVSTAIAPAANDGAALGDTTHNFSDLFLATGAVINYNNGNVVLTHSAGILTLGTGEMRITTPGANAASVVTVGGAQSLTAKDLAGGTVAMTGAIRSSGATQGIGYSAGAGNSATQASSKSTTVAFNAACGQITMNNAALAAGTIVSFLFTNTAIAATDVLILNHISGGTVGSYTLNAQCAAGSSTINVRNNTGGSLSEAIVIQFVLIKGVNS